MCGGEGSGLSAYTWALILVKGQGYDQDQSMYLYGTIGCFKCMEVSLYPQLRNEMTYLRFRVRVIMLLKSSAVTPQTTDFARN